jgi:hypothetical protein
MSKPLGWITETPGSYPKNSAVNRYASPGPRIIFGSSP